jgi:hypothetical protein
MVMYSDSPAHSVVESEDILNQLPRAVWVCDPDGMNVYQSRRCHERSVDKTKDIGLNLAIHEAFVKNAATEVVVRFDITKFVL